MRKESIKKNNLDKIYLDEFVKGKNKSKLVIDGDENVISDLLDAWISNIELPVEIQINYEWKKDKKIMVLDVDLPEINVVPSSLFIKTDTGKYKEKSKTQAELKQEYQTLVLGLSMYIASNIFNISPAIQKILISGYTQRRSNVGDLFDCYIYSILFIREIFEKTDLKKENPYDFCMRFKNRLNITKTHLLKEIVPYEFDDFEK